MLFPTTDFAIFFCVVFLGHWLLNPRPLAWKLFMIGASYVFYGWWNWRFLPLLAGVSIIAQLAALWTARETDVRRRRWKMSAGVAATLVPLLWFKYYGFFSLNIANALAEMGVHSPLPLLQLILPIGVSFFTFMAVSYVMDVGRRQFETASWIDVFLYLSFFPHLVAGPIVRPGELIPQLDVRRDPRHVDVAQAAYLILGGLFKKVVVSSFLATAIVDPVFGDPATHSALEVLVAVYAYAIVIYADFSGYTDIAIGIANLLGFQFPQNFKRPYSAASVQDFWRRWHMTLSRWLRDYLYIPLGGNRGSHWRTYLNLMITMVLGGLWHGAAWTFVFWGALHGVYLVVHHWKRDHGLVPPDKPRVLWGQRFVTFQLVCLGWIFFRSTSMEAAFSMLGRLFSGWAQPSPLVTPMVLFAILGMLCLQYAPEGLAARVKYGFARLNPAVAGIAVGVILFAIATLGPQGVAPFIYFQF